MGTVQRRVGEGLVGRPPPVGGDNGAARVNNQGGHAAGSGTLAHRRVYAVRRGD